jgi:hypothetical protein
MFRTYVFASLTVALFLAGCKGSETMIEARCGAPPGPSNEQKAVDMSVGGKLDASLLARGSAGAEGEFKRRVEQTSTQIFSSVGESGINRALEVTEYRVCVALYEDKTIPGEQKARILVELRSKMQAEAEANRKARAAEAAADEAARRAELAEKQMCFDTKVAAAQAAQTVPYNKEGGARANAPGAGGGRNTDTKKVCATLPAGYDIQASPDVHQLSCFSGRCSARPPTVTDTPAGQKNVCVEVTAWSESKSFGGGGSHQVRLSGTAVKLVSDAQKAEFRSACGL